jgi:hypothetical protein
MPSSQSNEALCSLQALRGTKRPSATLACPKWQWGSCLWRLRKRQRCSQPGRRAQDKQ